MWKAVRISVCRETQTLLNERHVFIHSKSGGRTKAYSNKQFSFFHCPCFQCYLKAFVKSLQAILCSWLEGVGSWPPVTVNMEFLESHARCNMA